MIHTADKIDLAGLVDLLEEFLQETSYNKHTKNIDRQHLYSLLVKLWHMGYVWYYKKDNKAVGILIAIREPNIWIKGKLSLKEMVLYVKEEHRNSIVAGKLFAKYCKEGDKLLEEGVIDGYTTTTMTTTADYNLTKRGFRQVEKLYIKD